MKTLPDNTTEKQDDRTEVGSSRDFLGPWEDPDFINSLTSEEQDEYKNRVMKWEIDGRLMPEDAEIEAYCWIKNRRGEHEK